jgi:hypothetical protein
MACYAAYLSALVDWRDVIVKGETGTVLIVANTTAQAKVAFCCQPPLTAMTSTKITVTKLDAARRQIRTAIGGVGGAAP